MLLSIHERQLQCEDSDPDNVYLITTFAQWLFHLVIIIIFFDLRLMAVANFSPRVTIAQYSWPLISMRSFYEPKRVLLGRVVISCLLRNKKFFVITQKNSTVQRR